MVDEAIKRISSRPPISADLDISNNNQKARERRGNVFIATAVGAVATLSLAVTGHLDWLIPNGSSRSIETPYDKANKGANISRNSETFRQAEEHGNPPSPTEM